MSKNRTHPTISTATADAASATLLPFWQRPLAELNRQQWEQLCDRCGRCCLVKLEDEESGELYYSRLSCELFDYATCRCRDYPNRSARVSGCIELTAAAATLDWLPSSCAYRLRAANLPLPAWHPLISARTDSVANAGIAVNCGIALSPAELAQLPTPPDAEDFLIDPL